MDDSVIYALPLSTNLSISHIFQGLDSHTQNMLDETDKQDMKTILITDHDQMTMFSDIQQSEVARLVGEDV